MPTMRGLTRTQPDVSVIVPVHNMERWLDECVASVLAQEGVTVELICVDDGSTDGSRGILKDARRQDRRVRLVRHQASQGAAAARNAGIKHSTGRYLQFTDADDTLLPGALASLHQVATESGIDLARGLLQRTDGEPVGTLWSGEQLGAASFPELQPFDQTRAGSLLELPELWIPWFHQCFLISAELLRSRDLRYPPLARGQDPPFLAQVLTAAREIRSIRKVTYSYRVSAHRPPPTFRVVSDYFASAEHVRRVYGREFASCWKSYERFIGLDLARCVESAELTEREAQWARTRLARFAPHRPSVAAVR